MFDRIRSEVSILNVVGSHVKLKKSGSNFTGLCPFHPEKTPSFVVNVEKSFYHCLVVLPMAMLSILLPRSKT